MAATHIAHIFVGPSASNAHPLLHRAFQLHPRRTRPGCSRISPTTWSIPKSPRTPPACSTGNTEHGGEMVSSACRLTAPRRTASPGCGPHLHRHQRAEENESSLRWLSASVSADAVVGGAWKLCGRRACLRLHRGGSHRKKPGQYSPPFRAEKRMSSGNSGRAKPSAPSRPPGLRKDGGAIDISLSASVVSRRERHRRRDGPTDQDISHPQKGGQGSTRREMEERVREGAAAAKKSRKPPAWPPR